MSFRDDVYASVRRIPKGKVATYGCIARISGHPGAARAVGNALHVNPDPDYTPCCRVVNGEGKLSAHFGCGGLEAQKQRLLKEGVEVKDGIVDLKKYGWQP